MGKGKATLEDVDGVWGLEEDFWGGESTGVKM
jgi:hypothetical protein